MHVIRHYMPFLDNTLPLPRQLPEYTSYILTYLAKQRFATILGNEYYVILTLPTAVT